MRNIIYGMVLVLVLVLVFFAACGVNKGTYVKSEEMKESSSWFTGSFTDRDFTPPFSFKYGGASSIQLLKKWPVKRSRRKLDNNSTEYTLTYTDPDTALVVRCVAVEYKDYPAVEWVVWFENASDKDTPIIKDVQAADFKLTTDKNDEFVLYYAEGSDAKFTDFQPFEKTIGANDGIKLSSYGGRSSDGFMPFFNVAKSSGGGAVVAIGWTGQWAAEFARTDNPVLNIKAGMELTHLKLHPGEKIRTPSMLVMFWSGVDRIRGHNQLRRLLIDHYTPTPGGKSVEMPVAASVHVMHGFDGATTEQNMIEFVNAIADAKLPVDYLWIDAGWYESTPPNKWVYTGTWEHDRARFPQGLRPVADAADKRGLKFILWFEPERVMKDSWLHKNRPEWCLAPEPDLPPKQRYQLNDGFYLLNLGDPEVLAWTKKKFSGMISEYGVDVYRQDYNIHPLHHWRNGESQDRQGINEIKYIMGLYDFLDTLLIEYPNLLIDNCASGGRRIDFEMLRRKVDPSKDRL